MRIFILVCTIMGLESLGQEVDANCFWRPAPGSRLSSIARKVQDFDACQLDMRAEILYTASNFYNNSPNEMNGTLLFQNETPTSCHTEQQKSDLALFTAQQRDAVQISLKLLPEAPGYENELGSALGLIDQSVICK